MKNKYDLYISFCDQDNIANEDNGGWVDNFIKFYSTVLSQLLNREANIAITSERESAKKEHGFTTEELLKNTSTFICIVSDNYVKDDNCLNELSLFNKHHGDKIKFLEEGKEKESTGLFKAVKNYTDRNIQPEEIKELIGYDLFRYDSESNDFAELVDFFNSEAKKTYWLSLVDLAYHAYQVITDDESAKQSHKGKTVFLAETTPDQSVYRNIVKRELESHGFRILPDKPLPTDSNKLETVINEYLKQSNIAIHIMGERYGSVLSNTDYSMPEIQNTFAARYCDENIKKDTYVPFERLVWISPDLNVEDEKQILYLDQLKKNIDNLQDAEIVQTPLEVFKTIVFNKASNSDNSLKRKLSQRARSETKSVYVVHGKEDLKQAKDLEEWAKKNSLEVLPSIFDGEQSDLVEKHRMSLAQCDGVVILYSHYNQQWLSSKLQDLKKAPGFGRKIPMSAKAIYMGLEDSNVKKIAVDNGLTVIENVGKFQSHLMTDFLNNLVAK